MEEQKRSKRPFSVTILSSGVLIHAIMNALRFTTTIKSWDLMRNYSSPPGPFYLALTGLIWMLIGLVLFYGLWRGYWWSRRSLLPVTILYFVYYWFDRLFFHYSGRHQNWLFTLSFMLIVIIIVIIAQILPASRTYFAAREKHER